MRPHSWILLSILFAIALPVSAQEGTVAVRIDGRSIFRVGAAESSTAAERARRIEGRIITTMNRVPPGTRIEVSVGADNGDRQLVMANGVAIATVYSSDAEDQVTSIGELATQWAMALEMVFSQNRGDHPRIVQFGSEVLASMRAAFSRLAESALRVVPGFLAAMLVLLLFWLLARGVRSLMRVLFRHIVRDLTMENLIKQVAYYSVWVVGLLVAGGAVGFEPEAVITGLGLTSLVLGFALKDILSNFVSGMLILLMRPFELGDQIVIGASEGAVEKVDLRATHIRNYDGRLSLVPNSEVFTSRVINNTDATRRRGSVRVAIGHPADLDHVMRQICAAAAAASGVERVPPPTAIVAELAKDDAIVELRFWTDSRRSDFLATTSAVQHAIYHSLTDMGVFPTNPHVRVIVPGSSNNSRASAPPNASP